jgi:hypothetical protein
LLARPEPSPIAQEEAVALALTYDRT